MESKIEYDPKDLLGQRRFCFVFRGTFRKSNEDTPIPVAVKRIHFVGGRDTSPIHEVEEEALIRLDHENIVRLYHVENQENDKFRCYALELCDASLDKVFLSDDDPKKYRGPLPSPIRALLQLAQGMEYIHSKKVIHRDIKPQNVLIVSTQRSVTMKWADFGLSKSMMDSQGNRMVSIWFRGTEGWVAPEGLTLLVNEQQDFAGFRGTTASDIFPVGCLFFFYLTGGIHPFGSVTDRFTNIQQGKHVNLNKLDRNNFAYGIIVTMLSNQPEKRPTMSDVVQKLPKSDEISLRDFLLEILTITAPHTEENIKEFLRNFSGRWRAPNEWTALQFLCRHYSHSDLIDIVRLLLDKGVDVNVKNSDGWTALHILSWNYTHDNLIDLVRLLVSKGGDANCKTPDGWTPLHILCCCNTHNDLIDIVRLLMSKGADVNCQKSDGWTALHLLARYFAHDNLIEIVRLLLDTGADVNCKDELGCTAFQYMCKYYIHDNLIDIVRLLLDKGVDVYYKEPNGWTALHFLCRHYTHENLIHIIRLLLDSKGVDVNETDEKSCNALHFLCRYYTHYNLADIVRLLLDKGVDANCKTLDGWTALHFLCCCYIKDNLVGIIRLLLDKGVDVNWRKSDGWTALHLLCRYYTHDNLIHIVQLFLDKGVDVNCHKSDGWTALHLLCRYYTHDNLIHIVSLLLNEGVDVNCKEENGWTPLHLLCRYYAHKNLIVIVRLFVDKGVDVYCETQDGCTPLQFLRLHYTHPNLNDIAVLMFEDIGVHVDGERSNGTTASTTAPLALESSSLQSVQHRPADVGRKNRCLSFWWK